MPSANRELGATAEFHDATKYVEAEQAPQGEHILMGTPPHLEDATWQEDWSLEPQAFKIYEALPGIELPREFTTFSMSALAALGSSAIEASGEAVPDRAALGRLGLLSNGLLNRQTTTRSGQVVQYRTAGGTGARYHLELYFTCTDLPGVPAGVYHYAAHDHTLRQLRTGDYRAALIDATGNEESLAQAPVILIVTSTFWRNAWRYKARAYRHAFWDGGTTLANVLAVATSLGLPTRVVLGYADAQVNQVLGVDGEREAAIVLCALGQTHQRAPSVSHIPPIDHVARAVSPREVTFPAIPRMHHASELESGAEAAAWRANPLRRIPPDVHGRLIALHPVAMEGLPQRTIDHVIFARRSTRHYDTIQPITFEAFSTLLYHSTRGIAADCLARDALPLHDEYLIVNAVEGLAPGTYLHHVQRGAIELLREGNFRAAATHLAVRQAYAGDAHVNAYYLTDLAPVLEHYGNRGYRLAQLECSLYAGRLHLAAHILGLGAVGSTSYDDEVVRFFAPDATGKSYMFVTVFGKRRPRASAPS